MAEKRLEITERDEAGNITATYVSSPTDTKGTSRVDVVVGTLPSAQSLTLYARHCLDQAGSRAPGIELGDAVL